MVTFGEVFVLYSCCKWDFLRQKNSGSGPILSLKNSNLKNDRKNSGGTLRHKEKKEKEKKGK